jgi:hypothetical protein
VDKHQYREAIAAIDDMEKKRGSIDWSFEMQRVYALEAIGDFDRAAKETEKMAAQKPDSVELAMMRADLLFKEHRWQEASAILKDVRAKNPNTPIAEEADRRLAEVPAVENLDKWYWGESYNSGDYHNRFDDEVGYGYVRAGTFIPEARWLQPYMAFNYVVDTRSGTAGGLSTIINDNSVGLYGGVRAQLFPTEYLFLYAQVGANQDLLGDHGHGRNHGNWRTDWQVGVYGYKAWGPGVNWTQNVATNGFAGGSLSPIWRGDWWADVDGDFSYYDRFASWLGYGQVREGLRLFQFGDDVALDTYIMENVAWDAKGNYTDNLFEVGPGVRLIYVPWRDWQVVLRTEWAQGWYMNRNDTNQRGNTDSKYGDLRVGVSVGVKW